MEVKPEQNFVLKKKWQELFRPFPIHASSLVMEEFVELVHQYASGDRSYHTIHHIFDALLVADELQTVTTDFTAVQLALYFHDIIYDPRASDNEAQSAAYAAEVLRRLGMPARLISVVIRLILLTKTHQTAENDFDGYVMLDADLAILAAEAAVYGRYARAIRQEYAFVPEPEYRWGRCQVLNRFLQRPHIFYTPQMVEFGEARARKNLAEEIERLGDVEKNYQICTIVSQKRLKLHEK